MSDIDQDLAGHLDALIERVGELEDRLDAMTQEVRTRRLVVVDRDGFERVKAGTNDTGSEAYVEVRGTLPEPDQAPAVMMLTSEAAEQSQADLIISVFEHNAIDLEVSIDRSWSAEAGIATTQLDMRHVVNDGNGGHRFEGSTSLSPACLSLSGFVVGTEAD